MKLAYFWDMERYTFKKEDKNYYTIYEGSKGIGSLSQGDSKRWHGYLHEFVVTFVEAAPSLEEGKQAFFDFIEKHPDGLKTDANYVKVRELFKSGEIKKLDDILKLIPEEVIFNAQFDYFDRIKAIHSPDELTIKAIFRLSLELQVPFRRLLEFIIDECRYIRNAD